MNSNQMQQTPEQPRQNPLGVRRWLRVSLFLVLLSYALFSFLSVNQPALAAPSADIPTGPASNLSDTVSERASLDDYPVLPVPEMAVTGNGVVIANGADTPSTTDDTDFGDGGIGGAVVTHTFTIRNIGEADLLLAGPSVVEMENGAHFSVLTQPVSTTVPGGEATTFVVAFNPEAAGTFTDTVRIASIFIEDTGQRDDVYFTFTVGGTGLLCPTGNIAYVDGDAETGSNDGTSWDDALTSLQDALYRATSLCPAVDQIWVAEGVYKPGSSGAITATFQLQSGLSVYGGFAGNENDLAERDWTTNVTVLSGDVDANDTTDANGVVTATTQMVGSNSYNVVTAGGTDSTALLDGFTISAGQADDGYLCPQACGGGMYVSGGSPTISHIIFSGNKATYGGGIYTEDGSATMSHVTFLGNSASEEGGGMYNSDHSSPVVDSVVFSANSAVTGGGGMANNKNSGPTLTNVAFDANSAAFGGGMENYESSNPTLTNVRFSDNRGDYGAGAYNEYDSSPVFTGVTFQSNTAVEEGGGLYNVYGSNPTLTNVTLSDNSANMGGGIANYDGASPTLTNVTLSSNRAVRGGGLYNNSVGTLAIRNSIFWNNQDQSGVGTATASSLSEGGNPLTFSYSLVQGAGGSNAWDFSVGTDGGHNIDTDPLLAALGVYGSKAGGAPATQTLPLLPGSPAIDAAEAATCPAGDQRGVSRPVGSGCDMGAFESQGFTLAVVGGSPQVATIDLDFAAPLSVTVTSSYTEPVDGGIVSFVGSDSGASATPASQRVTIVNGRAGVAVAANSIYGAHTFTASMAGATAAAKFSLHNVSPSTTSLANAPTSSVRGDEVTFTATVDAGATGVVTFSTETGDLGSAPVSSGVAIFDTSSLPVGTHIVTAAYSGDENFLPSVSNPVTQIVEERVDVSSGNNIFLPIIGY